jgi:hypothetical protein
VGKAVGSVLPLCQLDAGGSIGVGDTRRHGDKAAGSDGDRLEFGSDLEGELPFENVEGLGVPVDVWVGHTFACWAAGAGEAEVLVCEEEADL